MRMLVAGGVLLAFWGGAGLAKGPGLKTGLTIAGYGAGVRIFGKMAIDGLGAMLMTNQIGQQLFDGEMRANLLAQGKGTIATNAPQLPSAGLGRPRFFPAPFPAIVGAGAHKCAGCGGQTGYPAVPGVGAAWPSLPREIAVANATAPHLPPAMTAVQQHVPPGQQQTTTTTTTTTTTPPPPFSTTVIIPASGDILDPAQGYELAAVASPGATGVTFEGSLGPFPGSATQDLSGTWVLDVPAHTPICNNPIGVCFPKTVGITIQSVATYPGGVSVTSTAVDVGLVLYCLSPVGCIPAP
jgi:hypothetical protein